MHNILNRANSLLAFTLWVMAAVTAACFLSTVFLDYSTTVAIDVKDVKLRQIVDYTTDNEKADIATLRFSLEADFSKVFNWNVKQLFIFLVAEYKSAKNIINQVVIWDQILERADRVVVKETDRKAKYYFLDDGTHLINNKNVTFVLRYNVIPNSGYLRLVQSSGQVPVSFPTDYITNKRG